MHPAPKQNKTPKIVQVYEFMLEHGEVPKLLLLQPSLLQNLAQTPDSILSNACWHEFFNLQPNIEALEKELERLDEQRLLILLPFLNNLWTECVQQIAGPSRTDNCLNALLTLCCITQVICKKKLSSSQRTSNEILQVLTAVKTDEKTFENFTNALMQYFIEPNIEISPILRAGATFLELLLTSSNEFNGIDVFFEFLVEKTPILFDALTGNVLLMKKIRSVVGIDVLALLNWCCGYRRSEGVNPIAVKLSLVDAETFLNGFCQTIALSLEDEVDKFVIETYGDPANTSGEHAARGKVLSSIVSAVGSWFSNVAAAGNQRIDMDVACKTQLTALLSLYHAVYMNRSFMIVMMQSFVRYDDDEPAEFTGIEDKVDSSCNENMHEKVEHGLSYNEIMHGTTEIGLNYSRRDVLPSNCDTIVPSKRNSIPSCSSESGGEPPLTPADDAFYRSKHLSTDFGLPFPVMNNSGINSTLPSNLFVSFIEFFSIIMHDMKSDVAKLTTRLCFITLEIICEDQLVQSWLHDSNICYRVRILRAPLRHQRAAAAGTMLNSGASFDSYAPSFDSQSKRQELGSSQHTSYADSLQLRPLCHTLLDLMQEFMTSHFIVKQFPYENYMWALALTHRLVLYQKRQQIRLVDYPWRSLWECLCSVLKFVTQNHNFLLQRLKCDTFDLCDRIICIFNLFITCGDCFLTDGFAYDQLYYEIVRQKQVFEDLYTKCCAPEVSSPSSVPSSSFKPSATRLFNRLVNIRGILGHIGAKVEAATTSGGSLTQDQVLAIVRSSYASLTLRIPETIDDPIDRYVEKEADGEVLSQLMAHSMQHVRRAKLLQRVGDVK